MSGGFKAGQKVRPVKDGGTHYTHGEYNLTATFTVRAGYSEFSNERFVYFEELEGGWLPERFEAVPEVTAKVPSIKSDTQLGKVLALTLGQGAWTLAGIASVTGASEAAVSSRLRDLRAAGYVVTCVKHRGDTQRSYTVRTAPITVDTADTATMADLSLD